MLSVGYKRKSEAELRKTKDLEHTSFLVGFFLDYWGMPGVKSLMTKWTVVIDMPRNTAAIPGSGNTPIVFNHTSDIAKYVAASLALEKWDPYFYVMSNKVTWNEFLAYAEAAKGRIAPLFMNWIVLPR